MTATKLKTTLAALLVLMLCLLALTPLTTAFAQTLDNDDPFDAAFLRAVDNLAADEYTGDIVIQAEKQMVYDVYLNHLGYVYDFSVNGEGGYAIAVSTDEGISVAELFFKAQNPYVGVNNESYRIYNSFKVYTYFADDNNFYFAPGGEKLSDEIMEALKINSYKAISSPTGSGTDYIYYITKKDSKNYLVVDFPCLSDLPNYANACAPVACANIIQYLDRYYENLIPDYTPGWTDSSGQYHYNEPDDVIKNIAKDLYSYMGTNSSKGTTVINYKIGFLKYCTLHKFLPDQESVSYTDNLNYDMARQKLNEGKPLTVFVKGFAISYLNTSAGTEKIDLDYYADSNHVMACFGYRDITYELFDGTTRYDSYLRVATGDAYKPVGFIHASKNVTYNAVFAPALKERS